MSLVCSFSNANSNQSKAYFSKEHSFLYRGQIVVDGQKFEAKTMTYKFEISAAMKSNPNAYVQARNHEQFMDRSSLYLWGGLGLAVAYLISQGKNYSPNVYWGIFGAGLGISLYEKSKGNTALQSAITIYNKEF